MGVRLTLQKRVEPSPWLPPLLPLLSILLALLLGAGVLSLAHTDPWEAYREMVVGAFGDLYALSETLVKATPLVLTGLGVALAFRMRFWNIGAEGQLYMGAMGATWVALSYTDLPAPLLQALMLLVGG
ncbi:MAG: ABC transporter permease, partial [Nitrospinota bacterium]